MQNFSVPIPSLRADSRLGVNVFYDDDVAAASGWIASHMAWPHREKDDSRGCGDPGETDALFFLARPVVLGLDLSGMPWATDSSRNVLSPTALLVFQWNHPGYPRHPFPGGQGSKSLAIARVGGKYHQATSGWGQLPASLRDTPAFVWCLYLVQLAHDLEVRIPLEAWTLPQEEAG